MLAELREQGLIRRLGVSSVPLDRLTEAQSIAPVVTVQNLYNLANRQDDELVDGCAALPMRKADQRSRAADPGTAHPVHRFGSAI